MGDILFVEKLTTGETKGRGFLKRLTADSRATADDMADGVSASSGMSPLSVISGSEFDGGLSVSGLKTLGRSLTTQCGTGDEGGALEPDEEPDSLTLSAMSSDGDLQATIVVFFGMNDGHLNLRLSVFIACGVAVCRVSRKD